MNNPDLEILGQRIEQLVRDHMEECRRAALQVVERALAAGARPPKVIRASPGTRGVPRRSRAEAQALAERLYGAITDDPGAKMMRLAPKLGLSAAALQLPVSILRKAGRIRTIGAKIHMQYYPIAESSVTAA